MQGRVRGVANHRAVAAMVAIGIVVSLFPFVAAAGAGVAATPIGCDDPDEVLVLTADAELDPSCTYTGGIEIVASGVTLDCNNATIANDGAPGLTWGILIHAPVDVALSDVTVRNCIVEGFLNDVKITRDGFRGLAEGEEYDVTFSDIVLEGNTFRDSTGVGVFVDGYVTGVTIRDNLITGTGSSGIYLETGSTHSEVVDNRIVDNGFRENGPGGQATEFAGIDLWFWGVGREGVAIDGSRFNTIRGNHFEGNSAAGINIYKNCGEYPDRPRYFERRYGSHGNVIEQNTFVGGVDQISDNGIWVGSRMAENTLPMDCTDPAYVDEPLRRVVLDRASGNTVRDNVFDHVTYGIRVEDDDTVVTGNRFTGDAGDHAVIVGTPLRTELLGLPVDGTVFTDNTSEIAGNPTPYRWVADHTGTVQSGNVADGREVVLCKGQDPPRSPFVFAVGITGWDPSGEPPPRPPGLELPVLGPLPPCDQPDRLVPGFGSARPRAVLAPGAEPMLAERLEREPYRSVFLESHARHVVRAGAHEPGDPGQQAQKDMARAARWFAFEYALDRTVVDGAIVPFASADAREDVGELVETLLLGAYERSRFAVPPPIGGWDRDLDSAGELLQWSGALDTLLGAGYDFDGADRRIADRLIELAAELFRDYSRGTANGVAEIHQNNHRSKTGASLATAAVVLADYAPDPADDPDGSRSPIEWWDYGVTQVDEVLRHVLVTGDGAYAEGTHYLRLTNESTAPFLGMWERLLGSASWTTASGRDVPALHHTPLYAAMQDWMVAMTLPDGTLAPTDDAKTQDAYQFGALPPGLPDAGVHAWRWANGSPPYAQEGSVDLAVDSIVAFDDSVVPSPPDGSPTSFWYEGGNAVFRSGWGSTDTVAIVQAEGPTASEFGRDASGAGRAPQSHEHMEPGSFLLHAMGTMLVLDPGYLSFSDHGKVLRAEDHNMVLVDGVGPSPMLANSIAWRDDPFGPPPQDGFATLHSTLDTDRLDRARVTTRYGAAEGATDVTVDREVLFVDDRYLVIVDDVTPTADDTVRLDWVLHGNGGGTSGGSYVETESGGVWTQPAAGVVNAITTTAGAPTMSSRLEEHESPTRRGEERTHEAQYASVDTTGPTRAIQVVVPFDTQGAAPEVTTSTDGGTLRISITDPAVGRTAVVESLDGEVRVVDAGPSGRDVVAYGSDDEVAAGERTLRAPGASGVVLADGPDGVVEAAAADAAHSLFVDGVDRRVDVAGGCRTEQRGKRIRVDPADTGRVLIGRGVAPMPAPVVRRDAGTRVDVGSTVVLDASATCDLGGGSVEWELVSAPRGSAWDLASSGTSSTLAVDATGTFRVRVVATDGQGRRSDPVDVEILGGDRCDDERDDDLDGLFDRADDDCDGPEPAALVDLLAIRVGDGPVGALAGPITSFTADRRPDGSVASLEGLIVDGARRYELDLRVARDGVTARGWVTQVDPTLGVDHRKRWRGTIEELEPGLFWGSGPDVVWIALDRTPTG